MSPMSRAKPTPTAIRSGVTLNANARCEKVWREGNGAERGKPEAPLEILQGVVKNDERHAADGSHPLGDLRLEPGQTLIGCRGVGGVTAGMSRIRGG